MPQCPLPNGQSERNAGPTTLYSFTDPHERESADLYELSPMAQYSERPVDGLRFSFLLRIPDRAYPLYSFLRDWTRDMPGSVAFWPFLMRMAPLG